MNWHAVRSSQRVHLSLAQGAAPHRTMTLIYPARAGGPVAQGGR